MSSDPRDVGLRARLDELKDQLRVANETLEAIRSGEVDALVVGDEGQEQVYTLKGAEQPYRVLIEAMEEGAVTLTGEGDVLYCNAWYAQLVGRSMETVIGQPIWPHLAEKDVPAFSGMLSQALRGSCHGEVSLRRGDETVPVKVALSPLPMGSGPAVCMVVADLTEERQRGKDIQFLQELAVGVSQATDLDEALLLVVGRICEHTGWIAGQAWLPEASQRLRLRASYADGLTQDLGLALARRTWALGDSLFLPDLASFDGAAGLGSASALGIPVTSRDELVGVVTFLLPQASELPGDAVRSVSAVVAQLGAVIQRRQAEERTAASLREKEALLQEVHHRVKNNLQVITSLLRMQSRTSPDDGVRRMFKESEGRVRSMALVHEALYAAPDLARLDFGAYVTRLGHQLAAAYGARARRIEILVSADVAPVEIEHAVPLGLIVNELVSNALKHAFPDDRPGTIRIEVRVSASSELTVSVADDGVGFRAPPTGAPRSIGLQIVQTLLRHLDAQLTQPAGPGSRFVIRVPAPQARGESAWPAAHPSS
jgi:PAS domain S-box-containing protein